MGPRATGTWLLLLPLLAGCSAPVAPGAQLLALSGEGCDEVALVLAGDPGAVEAALPPGFAPVPAALYNASLPSDRPLVVVGVNRCAFTAGAVQAAEPEAFVWIPVHPPPALSLNASASHMYEALHWRPAGALLAVVKGALPQTGAADISGFDAPFAPGQAFAVRVAPAAGGSFTLNGTAAPAGATLRNPAGPCCRTFAPGAQGLAREDFTSSDQPYGEATCMVHVDGLAALEQLLGSPDRGGSCVHNAEYRFQATVAAA